MSRSSLGWQLLRSGLLGVTDAEQGWGGRDEADRTLGTRESGLHLDSGNSARHRSRYIRTSRGVLVNYD